METTYFKSLEGFSQGSNVDLEAVLENLNFNDQGLVPVIAQQYASKEVLMLAWMNLEAIEETLNKGRVCYWSRSRQTLWRKGESSGNTQRLVEMRIDCDGDTVLCLVEQTGPACHTNRPNCFYLTVSGKHVAVNSDPVSS